MLVPLLSHLGYTAPQRVPAPTPALPNHPNGIGKDNECVSVVVLNLTSSGLYKGAITCGEALSRTAGLGLAIGSLVLGKQYFGSGIPYFFKRLRDTGAGGLLLMKFMLYGFNDMATADQRDPGLLNTILWAGRMTCPFFLLLNGGSILLKSGFELCNYQVPAGFLATWNRVGRMASLIGNADTAIFTGADALSAALVVREIVGIGGLATTLPQATQVAARKRKRAAQGRTLDCIKYVTRVAVETVVPEQARDGVKLIASTVAFAKSAGDIIDKLIPL